MSDKRRWFRRGGLQSAVVIDHHEGAYLADEMVQRAYKVLDEAVVDEAARLTKHAIAVSRRERKDAVDTVNEALLRAKRKAAAGLLRAAAIVLDET